MFNPVGSPCGCELKIGSLDWGDHQWPPKKIRTPCGPCPHHWPEDFAGYVTRVHGETFANLVVKFSGEVARYLPLGHPWPPVRRETAGYKLGDMTSSKGFTD